MKKLFLSILGIVLATSLIFAAQAEAVPVNKTMIAETQLDNDPTSVTSSTFNLQEYSKVGFFVKYDETEVGETLSAAVTLDISYDGTNWVDASFYDYAGGATLQTSETISADGWYYCWFNPDLNAPYVRMVITATNTDADDIILATAYIVGIK